MKTCKQCGKQFENTRIGANNVKFCSVECRERSYQPYRSEFQRQRYDRLNSKKDANKIQCLICGRYYRQVGTHIVQRHGMTAREYREHFDLEVKRGLLPPDLREYKGQQALENGTVENLKKGRKFWFKKGDKVGNYKRSPETIKKLRELYKKTKAYAKRHKMS